MRPAANDSESGDIVVFETLRDSACAECGEKLWKGSLLRLEKERPPACLAPISHISSSCRAVMRH
jgi:hypothetical protein